MSKNYKIIKTTPSEVLFNLSPVSNLDVKRLIHLDDNIRQQALPEDWALGIFLDPGVYKLYEQGAFTFDDNEGIVQAAIEQGYFFGELDFVPADVKKVDNAVETLMKGNRSEILALVEKLGKDEVRDIALSVYDKLSQNVIKMLETILNVPLTMDVE